MKLNYSTVLTALRPSMDHVTRLANQRKASGGRAQGAFDGCEKQERPISLLRGSGGIWLGKGGASVTPQHACRKLPVSASLSLLPVVLEPRLMTVCLLFSSKWCSVRSPCFLAFLAAVCCMVCLLEIHYFRFSTGLRCNTGLILLTVIV